MRRSLPALFFLLLGILLVRHVRAAFPHIEDPAPEPAPEPVTDPVSDPEPAPSGNDGDDSPLTSGDLDGSDDDGGTIPSGGTPAAPAVPLAEGNEAEFEEEDVDYGEILEHVSDLLDAITSIIPDVADDSSTTVSAPLPTAALPCYSVSSIYDECGLHNSVFPNLVFPIQASCLCYVTKGNDTTATWAPSSYDGLMSRCNNFAQTQTLVSTVTKIGNSSSDFSLCSSAGDVRATPALAAASSTTTQSAVPASATTAATFPIATSTINSGDQIYVLRPLIACLGLWLYRMVM